MTVWTAVFLVGGTAASESPSAPTASQMAQAQLGLAKEVCAVVPPLQPVSPPFQAGDAEKFQRSRDNLAEHCRRVPLISGQLDPLLQDLSPEMLSRAHQGALGLTLAYQDFRDRWEGLVRAPESNLAQAVVKDLKKTEKELDRMLDALQNAVLKAVDSIRKKSPRRAPVFHPSFPI